MNGRGRGCVISLVKRKRIDGEAPVVGWLINIILGEMTPPGGYIANVVFNHVLIIFGV